MLPFTLQQTCDEFFYLKRDEPHFFLVSNIPFESKLDKLKPPSCMSLHRQRAEFSEVVPEKEQEYLSWVEHAREFV